MKRTIRLPREGVDKDRLVEPEELRGRDLDVEGHRMPSDHGGEFVRRTPTDGGELTGSDQLTADEGPHPIRH